MHKTKFPLLNQQDQSTLSDALLFMSMAELKKGCQMLSLPDTGKKGELIAKIMTFITTGTIMQPPKIPAGSRAKSHPPQPLAPTSLMLEGGYRNDAKTRAFFKSLIGPHFHFTAFGIDWLNERWLAEDSPTYQEFADYWTKEYEHRTHEKPKAKDEWAYINYLQRMHQQKPGASKNELMRGWQQLQAQQATKCYAILRSVAGMVDTTQETKKLR